MQNDKQNNMKYALAAFWAVVVFVILYKYTLNQLRAEGINDLIEHTFLFLFIFWTEQCPGLPSETREWRQPALLPRYAFNV